MTAHGHPGKSRHRKRQQQQYVHCCCHDTVRIVFTLGNCAVPLAIKYLMDDDQYSHAHADPFVQYFPGYLVCHQEQQGNSHAYIYNSFHYFSPSIHDLSSSSETSPSNLAPSSQLPLPALSERFCPLLPMPLPPDVQNGIMVIPLKS